MMRISKLIGTRLCSRIGRPATSHSQPRRHLAKGVIGAIFVVPLVLFWQGVALGQTEQVSLYPVKLTTNKGSASDQPLSVLAVKDQSGGDDDWNAYMEFYSGASGYVGLFDFDLPANATAADISSLSLAANYRGATRSEQRWRWQIRDFVAGKWVSLADNSGAADWAWSEITALADGDLTHYVNANKKLRVRYSTGSSVDNSDLDYLALNLSLSTVTTPTPPPAPVGTVWQPMPGTSWQLQLQGDIDTSYNVQMYDIDLFDTSQSVIDELHAQSKTVICYFSAGSWENWRPDADQYTADVKGNSNGWPGEKWLDIRNRDVLGPIIQGRLDLAASKHCDGVDPDNVDGYTNNTGFPLTYNDQLAFNAWLAQEAHARGLSIGLKNDLNQIQDLVSTFDWALNEQCFQYNECELLLPFVQAGKAVFGVEYSGDTTQFCPVANTMGFDFLKKELALGAWRVDCKDY